MMLASFTAGQEFPRGDVSQDGIVDIADVTMLINYLLTGEWPEPGVEKITVNGVSFKMVTVEGGTFMMGGNVNIDGVDVDGNELPAHEVTVSSFAIGQTEVTQELWMAVMGNNPSYCTSEWFYYGCEDDYQRPVEFVSWKSCRQFIDSLNKLTGRHFRLPTEAEWEFAARGGNQSKGYKYAGSNDVDEVAWYRNNVELLHLPTQPVGLKKPNELGLYDMSGNVFEWCSDWFGTYSSEAQVNPKGPSTGDNHVYRGGAWEMISRHCRCATRATTMMDHGHEDVGLRLAESVTE